MMRTILIIFFLIVLSEIAFSQRVKVVSAGQDKKVYITDFIYDADMVVYITESSSAAKPDSGIWYYVENAPDKGWNIKFVESKWDADLIVMFTNNFYKAGWTDKGKEKFGR